MDNGTAETDKTILDDLVYLTEGRSGKKDLLACSALVSYILDKLGQPPVQPPKIDIMVRTTLKNVATRAQSEASFCLRTDSKVPRGTVFHVAAAGELLGCEAEDDQFLVVRALYHEARNQSWEDIRRKEGPGDARKRDLRAGVWIAKTGRDVRTNRRDLLRPFAEALAAYLTSSDEAIRKEITQLRSGVADNSLQSHASGLPPESTMVSSSDSKAGDPGTLAVASSAPILSENPPVAMRPEFSQPGSLSRLGHRLVIYARHHWTLAGTGVVYTLMLAFLFLVPPTTRQPWAWLDDELLLVKSVPVIAWVAWISVWLLGMMPLIWPQIRSLKVLLSLLLTVSCAHVAGSLVSYCLDTSYARSLEAEVPSGDSLLLEDFDGTQACPPETFTSLPGGIAGRTRLTDCRFDRGILHARQYNPIDPTFGVYAPGDLLLELNPSDYYIETRFRSVDTTSIAACGIAITGLPEGLGVAWQFFHVKPRHQSDGVTTYTGEEQIINAELSDKYPTAMTRDNNATSGQPTPSVLRRSVPGWNYGTWTKLGVLIHNYHEYFFVNDRLSATVSDAPVGPAGVGPAVNASSPGNLSGDAACDFDYLYVQRLPEN